MDSILKRLHELPSGTVIPKPNAKDSFIIKGWGRRAGEPALVYFIPNHSARNKPYEKGITAAEWHQAFQQLVKSGEFTKMWFDAHMLRCSKEGACNFTTIGGIFSILRVASYHSRGVYQKLI